MASSERVAEIVAAIDVLEQADVIPATRRKKYERKEKFNRRAMAVKLRLALIYLDALERGRAPGAAFYNCPAEAITRRARMTTKKFDSVSALLDKLG